MKSPFQTGRFAAILDIMIVIDRTDNFPAAPGVYAWWFREIPPGLSTGGCLQHLGLRLLYVGISPKRPSASGSIGSSCRCFR